MFYLYFFKCKMLAHKGRPQTQSNFLAYEYRTNKKRTKSTTNESRKNKYTTSVFIFVYKFFDYSLCPCYHLLAKIKNKAK